MNETLAKYFNQHAARAGTCYYDPIVTAFPVKSGESYTQIMGGIETQEEALEDGFLVHLQDDRIFYDHEKFSLLLMPIVQWLGHTKRQNLPEGTTASKVNKGDMIKVFPLERSDSLTTLPAPTDGWIVTDEEENRPRFVDALQFISLYDTDAETPDCLKNTYRFKTSEDNIRLSYLRLNSDVSYRDDLNIPHIAYAGSMIIAIPGLSKEYADIEAQRFYESFSVQKPSLKDREPATVLKFKPKKKTP